MVFSQISVVVGLWFAIRRAMPFGFVCWSLGLAFWYLGLGVGPYPFVLGPYSWSLKLATSIFGRRHLALGLGL